MRAERSGGRAGKASLCLSVWWQGDGPWGVMKLEWVTDGTRLDGQASLKAFGQERLVVRSKAFGLRLLGGKGDTLGTEAPHSQVCSGEGLTLSPA